VRPSASDTRKTKSPDPVIRQTTFTSLPAGGGTGVKKSAQKLPMLESNPASGAPPSPPSPWNAAPGWQAGFPRLPR